MDVPQSGGVVEAAPVPDLLGSILSGQSMLLMDSSDVVINRDGSLKATKPMIPSALKPVCSKSSYSGDASSQFNPVMSPNQGDSSLSSHYNGDLPGSSHSSTNRPFSQISSRLPTHVPSSVSNIQPSLHSDLPSRGHPNLQPSRPVRPTLPPSHQGTNGVRVPNPSLSVHPTVDSSSKIKGIAPSHSQCKKAPTKPMWVDVSVLPRIPKIKRESSSIKNDGGSRSSRSSGNSSNSTTNSNDCGMPETGMNSLAGDKGRQQSVDHQKGRADGQAQRQTPDRAGSSSAFSNSFSSSSSSTGSPASQPRYSSSSSTSSAVSFRINPSGNSWYSRRLSVTSSSASGGNMQEPWREKEDEARKRQLHRDKQMLLASRTLVNKEQDSNNIYDPFNPTLSDSGSSDNEAESTSQNGSSRYTADEGKAPWLGNKDALVQNKQDLPHVKIETQEIEISEEEPRRANAQETISQEVRCSGVYVKVEKESRLVDTEIEKQTALLDTEVKKEPLLVLCRDDAGDAERFGDSVKSLNSETTDTKSSGHHSLDLLKTERETPEEESQHSAGTPNSAPPNCKNDSSASSSAPTKKKQKAETKWDTKSCSKSPSRDLGHKKKTFRAAKERRSSSPETDRCRRGEHTSGQGGRQKEKEKDRKRSSRRSRSRERRRARSTSESLQSSSPDKTHRKRQPSWSRYKDRRRSRSGSSSSSRERTRRKKHKQEGKDRNDSRERDCVRRRVSKVKRLDRSCSKSRSRSRSRSKSTSRSRERKRGRCSSKSQSKSRSTSRERKKDHTRLLQSSLPSRDKGELRSKDNRRGRSRSSSRERSKEEGSSSMSSRKTLGSCFSSSQDTKQLKSKKKEKDPLEPTRSSFKEEKVATVNKQETPSCTVASQVKNKGIKVRTDSQATTAEMENETKVKKEIKKEKQPSLDMFGESPITKPVKEEETVIHTFIVVQGIDEKNQEDPIKTETREIPIIKSEPSSPELCHLSPPTSFFKLTTPVAADSLQDMVSQSHPMLKTSDEQPNTVGLTVPVKQEGQLPSDSDDDFNVDMMLDNLDYVKSECTEGGGASVKQEMEEEEGKNELTVVGAKSKTQVKRVTWNIQEPEGPQPGKSASKLALYKLRLKQEGARRPSLTGQTSSQDIIGAVSDHSKKGAISLLSTSSRPDGAHSEGLSTTGQGEAGEGDLSRKDKYLKKLHMQERAIEEVKLAIKPFYQRRDINKDEYKEILRKAVQKVCHSKSGEINPVKVGNLVKAYVDKYKHARKHKRGDDSGKAQEVQTEAMKNSGSP